MTLAYHCEREGCDTWARISADAAQHFITVTAADKCWHFCTLDCCMKWCADHSQPTEVIRVD